MDRLTWHGGRIPRAIQDKIAPIILSLEKKGLIKFCTDGETVHLTTKGKVTAISYRLGVPEQGA